MTDDTQFETSLSRLASELRLDPAEE
jgi:hypothetical protein